MKSRFRQPADLLWAISDRATVRADHHERHPMRRKEFRHDDDALLEELAASCLEGYLALTPNEDGYPRAVAVNFALHDGAIWFHGALAGDKFDRIAAEGRVGFTMVVPYSLTPSTWATDDGSACPATQLYTSVEVYGRCHIVDDPAQKATGLQALMQKYQPEGGYRPITHPDPGYERSVGATGVFRIEIESWSGKARLAQNQSEAKRRKLVALLRQRGLPVDLATAERIEGLKGSQGSRQRD